MEEQPTAEKLSKSSRWNILFMKRTNRLAIIMFVGGILIKLGFKLFGS